MSYAIFRDKNLRPENIKKGVKIFRTVGTLEGGGGVIVNEDITADPSTASQSFTAGEGYDGIGLFTLLPYVLDTKTVNSSTNAQTVTSDEDGLASVTVNPYVLDSKTVNSSTAQQVINSSADGMSSVTVLPYVLDSKTVNSSTARQIVTPDHDGLSSVTVNPYTLDTKTVDPSTSQVTVNSSADGMSSVTVNAVTSSIDSNIVAGNIKSGVSILGVTGSYGADANWIAKAKQGQIRDLSPYTLKPMLNYGCAHALERAGQYSVPGQGQLAMTDFPRIEMNNKIYGLAYALRYARIQKSGDNTLHIYGDNPGIGEFMNFMESTDQYAYSSNLAVVFDQMTTMYQCITGFQDCFRGVYNLVSVSFPLLTSITGFNSDMKAMFYDCQNLTTVNMPELLEIKYGSGSSNSAAASWFSHTPSLASLSFPKLTTWLVDRNNTFGTALRTISTPSLYNYSSSASSPIHELEGVTTITTHPGCVKGSSELTNFYWWCSNATSLTLTGMADDDVRLDNMASLDRTSIVGVLQHLDTGTSGKTCTFYTGGLFVLDDTLGSVQGIYDLAVQAGWTINNLTIGTVRVTSPSDGTLNIDDSQTITFDAAGAWTATTSSQDITLSSGSGSAGNAQSITVSVPSGWVGTETVTITSGSYSANVTVKSLPVTFVSYVDTNGGSISCPSIGPDFTLSTDRCVVRASLDTDVTNGNFMTSSYLKIKRSGGSSFIVENTYSNYTAYISWNSSNTKSFEAGQYQSYSAAGKTYNSENWTSYYNRDYRGYDSAKTPMDSGWTLFSNSGTGNFRVRVIEFYANYAFLSTNTGAVPDGAVLKHSLKPAQHKSTQEYGLYDTVTGDWYPNSSFTGPA